MAGSLRDLKVWQEAVALGGEVLARRTPERPARNQGRAPMHSWSPPSPSPAISPTATDATPRPNSGSSIAPRNASCSASRPSSPSLRQADLALARGAREISSKRIQASLACSRGYLVYLERQRASEDEDASPASAPAADRRRHEYVRRSFLRLRPCPRHEPLDRVDRAQPRERRRLRSRRRAARCSTGATTMRSRARCATSRTS